MNREREESELSLRRRRPAARAHRTLRDAEPVPPPEPTRALPGSPAKVEVLAARRAAGCHLWHPADARPDDRVGLLLVPGRVRVVRVVSLPGCRVSQHGPVDTGE